MYVYVGVFSVCGVDLFCSSKIVGRFINRE